MSTLNRWVMLVCASAGVIASASSTLVHYRMMAQPDYLSFCDISSTVSCTQVYRSPYAMFQGTPVALWGLLWFVLVLLLLAAERWGKASFAESVPAYLFALSTPALAVVLYLAYASFVTLKLLCILCAITYVSVIGIFLGSNAATSYPMATLPRRLLRDMRTLVTSPAALLISIVFVAGAASALAFFPRETTPAPGAAPQAAPAPLSQEGQSEFERYWVSQPRVQVPVPRDKSPVLIVEFSDYQCPGCRQAFFQYQPLFAKFRNEQPGAVQFVSKDFPLDSDCNSKAPKGMHPAACEAAVAVRIAKERNQGDRMENWLFNNQDGITPERVRDGVREITGVTDFDARYPKLVEQVKVDVALGQLLGVNATPTFFINGVKIEGGLQPAYFEAAINYEIKHPPAPPKP